jgi:hypothetical protein
VPGICPGLAISWRFAALEVDRVVSKDGQVSLGGRYYIAAEILSGMRVSIRIEQNTLMFFDPATRELLRTRHARQIVTIHVAADTITIDLAGDDTRTVRRTTTQPVRSIKAHRPREIRATHVSWGLDTSRPSRPRVPAARSGHDAEAFGQFEQRRPWS